MQRLVSSRNQTAPYSDQKPGTSGLRKKTVVFKQKDYVENFVQSIFDSPLVKKSFSQSSSNQITLVLGGDGRYYVTEVATTIIQIAAANKIDKLMVARDGVISTPAVSHVIRKYRASGGIVLTASHNPGGPDMDFGIKYNISNGGPAPSAITDSIYETSKTIQKYQICRDIHPDLSQIGIHEYQVDDHQFVVEIFDAVKDYSEYMQEIFDFNCIRTFLENSKFSVTLNALNGVMGPYVKEVMCNQLGLPASSAVNCVPLPDFGGLHPDPNLIYADSLVQTMCDPETQYDFGAAFDGDGDRNMILGKAAFFVSPSDSLAVLADHLDCIPYFKKYGIKGFARSMPTAAAVDLVAKEKGMSVYEVPTGWKYFGNLMDSGMLSLCGEESFGTGSDHIREKDGMWAVLAWLSVIASTGKSVEQLLTDHWNKYGRNYFTRYDYENCSSESGVLLTNHLRSLVSDQSLVGKSVSDASGGQIFTVAAMDDFEYKDPVDQSITSNQGVRIIFTDGSRVIVRLSGTGSSGATIRLYVEKFESDREKITLTAKEMLNPLIQLALKICKINEFSGREEPTVIT